MSGGHVFVALRPESDRLNGCVQILEEFRERMVISDHPQHVRDRFIDAFAAVAARMHTPFSMTH
jgi:hypothetical protein